MGMEQNALTDIRGGFGPQSSTWCDKGKMSAPQIRRRLSDIPDDDETDEKSGERLWQWGNGLRERWLNLVAVVQ